MDKRLPLALLLSFIVWFGWLALNPPAPRPEPGAPVGPAPEQPAEEELAALPDPADVRGTQVVAESEEDIEVEFGEGDHRALAVFSNRGAELLDLRIGDEYSDIDLTDAQKADPEYWARLVEPVDDGRGRTGSFRFLTSTSSARMSPVPLDRALWKHRVLQEAGVNTGIEFEYAPGTGVRFVKRLLFDPQAHRIALELEIENQAAADFAGARQFVLVPAACMPRSSEDGFYVEPKAVAVARKKSGELTIDDKERRDSADDTSGLLKLGDLSKAEVSFVGVHNKYFAMLLREADDREQYTLRGARYRRVYDSEWAAANPEEQRKAYRYIVAEADLQLVIPQEGSTSSWRWEVYAGPKQRDLLVADHEDHRRLIKRDLGYFNGIATLLTHVLGFFHGLTSNWGWAIILLTVSVRLILFPVNRRSQTAMARYQTKMKRIQPRIDEVKKKYEKDPQRQRQEQAKIMQEEGAFPPLGGCLPIFVQIPVFIGLFQALRVNFDLRHAPFLGWIHDLSMPDRLMRLDIELPFGFGIEYLNLLPPLMVVSWILQQRAMPKPTDEQAARMQKMMMWMPIMMGFFLYNYAAGLSLYMITTSLFGLIETRVIKKFWPVDDTEQPKKRSGFMARLQEAQKLHMERMEQQRRSGQGRGGAAQKGKGRNPGPGNKGKGNKGQGNKGKRGVRT